MRAFTYKKHGDSYAINTRNITTVFVSGTTLFIGFTSGEDTTIDFDNATATNKAFNTIVDMMNKV